MGSLNNVAQRSRDASVIPKLISCQHAGELLDFVCSDGVMELWGH